MLPFSKFTVPQAGDLDVIQLKGIAMTEKNNEIQIIDKMVVTSDICSSSHIIENLIKRSKIDIWRNTLIEVKKYISEEAHRCEAEIYKFTGDGWIILFEPPYAEKDILKFLRDINIYYENLYKKNVLVTLDIPPKISGMTFGVDEGQLVKMEMLNQVEYIGRPLNIACRLQRVINEIDINVGYRAFLSHIAYNLLKQEADAYYPDPTERLLKNISENPDFRCYRLAIEDTKFRILKASYGTSNNKIDVTYQYTKRIINGCLDVVVSNEIAENDPHRGFVKILTIEYIYKGKKSEKQVHEGARIQLP